MMITGIEVDGVRFDPAIKRTRGSVGLVCGDRYVQFESSVDDRPSNSPMTRKTALVRDALRQLGRMPEFRNGQGDFRLADGLMPEFRAA